MIYILTLRCPCGHKTVVESDFKPSETRCAKCGKTVGKENRVLEVCPREAAVDELAG